MTRILIADDHAIVRRGIKDILSEGFPSVIIAEAENSEDLINRVLNEDFDIVLTDLSMPGRSGLEALQQIKQLRPGVPVLILSMHPEEQYAIRVFKAGASGYLNKNMAPEELIAAIKKVLAGKKYISPEVAERLAGIFDLKSGNVATHETLSDREFEILKLIASGKAISEISDILKLGVTTVSTYRARILTKLRLKTNADLTQYAIIHHLI